MAWYDNPINDLYEQLLGYIKEHDVCGIVEYIARQATSSDINSVRVLGVIIVVVLVMMIVTRGFRIFKDEEKPRKK